MELVREDGSCIVLEEGQRHELGRGPGFADSDGSVSRQHVAVELLRPASRKGKEIVGKSLALKLLVHVLGRNPICIASRGRQGNASPKIKFCAQGDVDLLAPGDEFSLSIKRPSFFRLRKSASGRSETENESQSMELDWRGVEDVGSTPMVQTQAQSRSMEEAEEEGIAQAVARRERRRLGREVEAEAERLPSRVQQQSQNGGFGNSQPKPQDAMHHEEASPMPYQTSSIVHPFDPATEFGFLVKGSEFEQYKKHKKADSRLEWTWKIDKKGKEEDSSYAKTASKNKKSLSGERGEDYEEWGGDSKDEQERITKVVNPKIRVLTRGSGPKVSDPMLQSSQPSTRKDFTQLGKTPDDDDDMSNFIVDSDASTEEDDIEDEEDWTDDVGKVGGKVENGRSSEPKPKSKPACKYGSKCYRKNKDHLLEFGH